MAKQAKTDRQKVIDDIRRKEKRASKRQGTIILTVCIAIAVLIIGAVAFPVLKSKWDQREYNSQALSDIGAPASSCQPIETKHATGNQQHVPEDTPVDYPDSPPAFGAHWNTLDAPASMARKVWTKDDRPPLEALVHNLEHGFTIVWYDETIADDQDAMDELRGVGKKFPGISDMRHKFYAAPWTSDDGDPFPDGQHIALTHWSIGGVGNDPQSDKQVGVWQYCKEFSGEALQDFMIKYPYFDSPEPNAMSGQDL